MKKILFVLLAVLLAVSLTVPGVALAANWWSTSEYTVDGPTSYKLMAGQFIEVGNVTVDNDGDTLYVQYNVTAPWYLTETHVAIGEDLNEIPQNGNGNPKVGHFAYGDDSLPPQVGSASYSIPLPAGVEEGDTLIIAAHCVVVKIVGCEVVQEETAWTDGEQEGGNPSIDVDKKYSICSDDPNYYDVLPDGYIPYETYTYSYQYVITNDGDVTLTGITLYDDMLGDLTYLLPKTTLVPGEAMEVIYSDLVIEVGDTTNTATVTGWYNGSSVSDSDTLSFVGVPLP